MNLTDNTEVTTLRLELGRITDKANALEAALRKEVASVIKDALSDNARIIAENYRLKAEVERLRKAGDAMYEWICLQSADVGNELEDWDAAKEGKPTK